MKSKLFKCLLSLLCAAPLWAQGTNPAWTLTSAQVRIPYGQSVLSVPLAQPRTITPFRVLYVPSPSCNQFGVRPRVRYQGHPALNEVLYQNNLFLTDNKPVDLLELNFVQNTHQYLACQIIVQSFAPQNTPQPTPSVYAGLLEHTGGFVNRKPVTLNAVYRTQDIELVIPDYCQGYEVSEFSVATGHNSGFADAASTRARTLHYHLDQPTQVSQVLVSILAPAGLACQIPIYVRPL